MLLFPFLREACLHSGGRRPLRFVLLVYYCSVLRPTDTTAPRWFYLFARCSGCRIPVPWDTVTASETKTYSTHTHIYIYVLGVFIHIAFCFFGFILCVRLPRCQDLPQEQPGRRGTPSAGGGGGGTDKGETTKIHQNILPTPFPSRLVKCPTRFRAPFPNITVLVLSGQHGASHSLLL